MPSQIALKSKTPEIKKKTPLSSTASQSVANQHSLIQFNMVGMPRKVFTRRKHASIRSAEIHSTSTDVRPERWRIKIQYRMQRWRIEKIKVQSKAYI